MPPRLSTYLKSLALGMALCINSIGANERANTFDKKIIIGTSEIVGKLTRERDSIGFYDRFLSQLYNVELVFLYLIVDSTH